MPHIDIQVCAFIVGLRLREKKQKQNKTLDQLIHTLTLQEQLNHFIRPYVHA